jgi:hypothetical protein
MLPCERCWACRRYLRFRQADRGGHSQDAERSHPRTGLILSCSSWASGAVLVLQHVRRLWSFCHAVAAVGPQVLTGSFRRYSNSSTDQVDRSPPHWGCESRGDPIMCGVSRPARQFGGQGATSQIEDRTRPQGAVFAFVHRMYSTGNGASRAACPHEDTHCDIAAIAAVGNHRSDYNHPKRSVHHPAALAHDRKWHEADTLGMQPP